MAFARKLNAGIQIMNVYECNDKKFLCGERWNVLFNEVIAKLNSRSIFNRIKIFLTLRD